MSNPSRMPRYDVRNDGAGPYAVFYCDECDREFRSQPDFASTVAKDVGRQSMGGLLRKVPLFGDALAENVTGEDPRYVYSLNSQQLESAWKQVQDRFRECPTCGRIVCLSDFDEPSGFCNNDSPRREEIAEATGEQAGAALRGLASAFGLGDVVKRASDAMQQANANMARCPQDNTLAPAGTKFCPNCGSAMVQPASTVCSTCGQDTHGAKFCPNCGTKQVVVPSVCPNCGEPVNGAKFCSNCGTRIG